jgi:hypothetical protein
MRLDKRALFDLCGYAPHAGQVPIHSSSARFRVVSCGVRFGKTTAAAFECIDELMAPREENSGWVVPPTKRPERAPLRPGGDRRPPRAKRP